MTPRHLGVAGLALVAFLADGLAAAPPPPVNLGATGLAPAIYLHHYTEASGQWTEVDPSAVTVTDIGNGYYQLDDLPAASGTDRYRVGVYLTGDPARELAQTTYGALPGSQVLWVPRIDAPEPHRFFVGDSSGTIGLTVRSGLPEAVTDPGTTVTLDLVPETTGAALLTDAPAQVAAWVEDANTGTYGATLVHALQAGELTTAGRYLAYFTLVFPAAGGQTTLPKPGAPPLRVTVATAPGGAP